MSYDPTPQLESLISLEPENADAFVRYLHEVAEQSGRSALLKQLCLSLETSCSARQENNTCWMRFPAGYEDPTTLFNATQFLQYVVRHLPDFEAAYDLLEDEASRSMFAALLSFKALGGRRIKLPTNTKAYWDAVARAESTVAAQAVLPTGFMGWSLDRCSLESLGFPLTVLSKPVGVLGTFLLRQYEYHGRGFDLAAAKGDIVIDGGACYGETALYFAHLVGPQGKVFGFEFLPFNLTVMRRNLEMNDHSAGRVTIVESALWDTDDQRIGYRENGPGSSLDTGLQPDTFACTRTIDTFVREAELDRVDFIKMDIEGSELAALHGAERTIRQHRPKLAICVYHKWEDFMTIPRYLESLHAGYRFALGHYSIHAEETVLFAAP